MAKERSGEAGSSRAIFLLSALRLSPTWSVRASERRRRRWPRGSSAMRAQAEGRDLRPTATDRPTIRERENRTGYIEAASGKALRGLHPRPQPPARLSSSVAIVLVLSHFGDHSHAPSFSPLPFPPSIPRPPKVRPTCSERYSDFVPARVSPLQLRLALAPPLPRRS